MTSVLSIQLRARRSKNVPHLHDFAASLAGSPPPEAAPAPMAASSEAAPAPMAASSEAAPAPMAASDDCAPSPKAASCGADRAPIAHCAQDARAATATPYEPT